MERFQWLNGFVDWFDEKFIQKKWKKLKSMYDVCDSRNHGKAWPCFKWVKVYNLYNWSTATKITIYVFSILNEIWDSDNEKITKINKSRLNYLK